MRRTRGYNLIDMKGKKCGRLTVIKRAKNASSGQARWICLCDCGNQTVVIGTHLRNGNTKSCGCKQKDVLRKSVTTHGLSRRNGEHTRLYRIWSLMRRRCYDKNNPKYIDYGGRGIKVCAEWGDYPTFHSWAMENGYRDDLTIDRIDNDGDYCPENCRWATHTQQMRNTRNPKRILSLNGRSRMLSEWSEITGISASAISSRIDRLGWPVEKALTTPVKGARK